jgi:hypothetical protein
VTIDELRTEEISIRAKLATVRTELATAVANLADATRAKEQIAAGDGPNDGVYRKPADERFGDLRERAAVRLAAESDRERLRAQESTLLFALERNRQLLEERGVRRVTLPALTDIPNAAPCATRWEDMTGDGDERVCTKCNRIARNIALIEDVDAKTFLSDPNTPFHRRADGTILAGNCKEGEHSQRVTRAMTLALAAIAIGVAGILVLLEAPKKQAVSPPTFHAVDTTPPYMNDDHPPGYRGDAPTVMPVGDYQDRLHDVSSMHLVDTSVDHGVSRKIDLTISPMGSTRFAGFLSCNGSSDQQLADVATITMQSFFDEINATPNADSDAAAEVTCSRLAPARKAQIDFVMPGHKNTVTLTMNGCGSWTENGKPLLLQYSSRQDPLMSRISARYENILLALPRTECTPSSGATQQIP